MQDPKSKPILVTGSHRSGSSWVGRMIAMSPSVGYIHEPFNIVQQPGICGARFDYWFTYLCDENGQRYYDDIRKSLEFRYQFGKVLPTLRTPVDAYHLVKDFSHFTYCRTLGKRPLMKDPLAVFSAEWLAKTFGMDVVILIRHPAGFAGSLKKANRPHPFDHFLRQPLLMEQHLSAFRSEIEEFSKSSKDIVDQAILLWNIIYSMVLKYKEKHPEWIFVQHKALSDDPISGFSDIFGKLNLPYPQSIEDKIREYSSAKNPSQETSAAAIRRNSKANWWNWKNRLTNEEIARIREKTGDISRHFSGGEDWWSMENETPGDGVSSAA
jgi:hypothetical protein